MDLAGYLNRKSAIPNGRTTVMYSKDLFPFDEAVKSYLRRKIPSFNGGSLAHLHELIPLVFQTKAEKGINGASCRVGPETPEVLQVYHKFIRYLSDSFFQEDLVFEAAPQLRFHFPVPARDTHRRSDGRLACQHSDIMFGDYFEQINCWLPITACRGTNALEIAELASSVSLIEEFVSARQLDLAGLYESRELFFDELNRNDGFHEKVRRACQPVEVNRGEALLFDSRCLHGTAENIEQETRVSIDFRVLTVPGYVAATAARKSLGLAPVEIGGEPLLKGSFFDARTAYMVGID
ncbi:MAG: hypothetical protein M0D55_09510 [Elusimicrobiota bacterium]|nr:MAG: hypothetical protein M0D55_09510 [Elusimicrobiota bacterium]